MDDFLESRRARHAGVSRVQVKLYRTTVSLVEGFKMASFPVKFVA